MAAQKKVTISDYTLVAISAAISAGNVLRQGFRTQFQISSKKGRYNLVTEYDLKVEKMIIRFIKDRFPNHQFLAEESGHTNQDKKNEIRWIIDPLDGTVNFAHGIPFFAVSIAVEQKGDVVSAVTYAPMTQELFTAEKGKGSFYNGSAMQVSQTKSLNQSLLATGFPYNLSENPYQCTESFMEVLKQGTPIRRLGAACLDLCYLAAGRFDGFFESTLAPWDVAAGILMLKEAGGRVSEWDLSSFDVLSYKPILATNSHIHTPLSKLLMRKS